jgi:glycine/D-amino acid oxidase-like deaminating enzyme
MDLRTYYPYSLLKYGIVKSYPSLSTNIKTDVAVIGAGISGALAAYYLNKEGINCVIADKGHVAMGSTAASTSLIQYEIDVPLHKLIKFRGYNNAVRSYKLCKESIYELKNISDIIGNSNNFEFKESLQFASYEKHIPSLEKEFTIRKENGFDVDLIDSKTLHQKFKINAEFGLLSYNSAQLDAYLFTHRLLDYLSKKSCSIYDHTNIVSIRKSKNQFLVRTQNGNTITSKYVIIACGYESAGYIKNTYDQLRTTYAVISEPTHIKQLWPGNCLIWETADPYIYIRTTADNRILIGGKDTDYYKLDKQLKLLPSKAKALEKRFQQLFPAIPFKTDFCWAGAFTRTKDGLPYIGNFKNKPGIFYSLGYGGNGITFSVIGGQLICDAIRGKQSSDMELFSFYRT